MKSPEEYAEELVWQLKKEVYSSPNQDDLISDSEANICAIITLDRIIEANPFTDEPVVWNNGDGEVTDPCLKALKSNIEYYQKVKEHLKTKI